MGLTALPHLVVTALPDAIAGKPETATLALSNRGTATGRWIVRGAIYTYKGKLIGSYVSVSVEVPAGGTRTVQLTTNGAISSAFAGHYVVVKFTANSGSVNSGSADTYPDPEYRLHVLAAGSTTTSTGTGTPSGQQTPPTVPNTTVPTPWYKQYLPELVGAGVAAAAIGVGLAIEIGDRRAYRA